ncbi:hypothetical protein NLJ89_g725 [Agrocybe chaxingu]|uniref:CAF1B/HIR1 beta-propeller domain-containing protein n=1 Tax=Agrocybe chaxingu TaxID=84603 RepID=A0A9W8TG63_9AGAR|nr:hypothetical protein NLJ89_g725 [Agrocybe chaxingu]
MRFRTLEIRWHDSKPISTCDFQPVSFKKARPAAGQEKNYASQSYRLATGGEDNHVRIWMVHPYIRPPNLVAEADPAAAANAPRAPRVEYLATLSRHSAAVNVVRFSPMVRELIASAGDDGMIIIWAPSSSPQTATYGSDLTAEELQHEKEFWKPRTTFRCTTMQVYDLAWSPTGEYIIAGSTDNTARIFAAADGKCMYEIAEHSHYVQGVAWDPLNEYIATQSSDRSMHIYRVSTKPGGAFEVHAVGKNTRMPHRHSHSHSRTPSAHGGARPRGFRRESTTSDVESSSALVIDIEDPPGAKELAPLTPATSVASTPAFMFPPPPIEASSRRSSFSSNAPGSPSTFSNNNSRYGRSPSPMPPLPAIRSPQTAATAALWASVKLYGDESYTNFFRRLTFSPDGGLLLTPAGQFEDPSVNPLFTKFGTGTEDAAPTRGRKGHPSESTSSAPASNPTSSVYIYSRANFARPPIAQLPGHKKSKRGTEGNDKDGKKDGPPIGVLEKGVDGAMEVDVIGPVPMTESQQAVAAIAGSASSSSASLLTPQRTPASAHLPIATPTPRPAVATSNFIASSPALSPMDLRPPTPAASKPSTPAPSYNHGHSHSQSQSQASSSGHGHAATVTQTGSVFALPYRMLFAVETMDTVAIYDTQQASPVALLTKLHYDEFTDMTWSPDGQCLILSSRDGYCTLVVFDDILPAYHTQQHSLQMQSIASHNFVPLTLTSSNHPPSSMQTTPAATPSSATSNLPFISSTPVSASASSSSGSQPPATNLKKRSDPPLTPAASVDGSESMSYFATGSTQVPQSMVVEGSSTASGEADAASNADKIQEPPKKKRRVALTRVGDLDS